MKNQKTITQKFFQLAILLALLPPLLSLTACAGSPQTQPQPNPKTTNIHVFIAASLQNTMNQLAEIYRIDHPDITITYQADSSGTLMTQIREGFSCDIFFSAAQKQMNQLEADGLLVEGTRADVVQNQLVVITGKGSGTKVTGLSDLGKATSLAIAGGSVPVGSYTRQALASLGILEKTKDPSEVTTRQLSDALGGVQISEQDNVSKVLLAVAEGSCEVGTVYRTDIYGYEDQVELLETVSYDLTGTVAYPAARVVNEEADEIQAQAAEEFLTFLLSEKAQKVFAQYGYSPQG